MRKNRALHQVLKTLVIGSNILISSFFMINCVDAQGLLVQAIVLGFFSIGLTKHLNSTYVSAASAFWFGWILLLLGTVSYIDSGDMDKFGEIEVYYISTFHLSTFIGFLLGSIRVSFYSKSSINHPLNKLILSSKYITEVVTDKLLNILLIVGLIFFAERVIRVGFTINFFTDVRTVHLERSFNLFEWFGRHLTVIINFCIIMLGVNQAVEGMQLKKVGKVILFSAPLFLASGTRTFLIFPILGYLMSFLLIRGAFMKTSNLKSVEIKSLLYLFSIVLLIFSIIGFYRGGYGDEFSLYKMIVSWPVSTSFALDSWLSVAETSSGTNGLLTFEWFVKTLDKVGIMNYSQEMEYMKSVNSGFIESGNSAAFIPKSIIPDIIFDFGKNSVFIVSIIMGFILQYGSLRFNGRGVVLHTIAVLLTYSAFSTIQGSFFGSIFIITVFWSIVFNKRVNLIMKKSNKNT
jgi:oligosaccharide repeat unit polymerase